MLCCSVAALFGFFTDGPLDSYSHFPGVPNCAKTPSVPTFESRCPRRVKCKVSTNSFSSCFQIFGQLPALKQCWQLLVSYFFLQVKRHVCYHRESQIPKKGTIGHQCEIPGSNVNSTNP